MEGILRDYLQNLVKCYSAEIKLFTDLIQKPEVTRWLRTIYDVRNKCLKITKLVDMIEEGPLPPTLKREHFYGIELAFFE